MIRPKLVGLSTKFSGLPQADAGWNNFADILAAAAANPDANPNPTGVGAPGSGGPPAGAGSGGPVDLTSLINNDPFWRQQQADIAASGSSDAAQRAANIRQTLINWGIIPDFAAAGASLGGLPGDVQGFLSSDVDANTRALAQQNTDQGLSISAQIDKNNNDNIRAIRNALAARGMYQSGELGHGLTENAQNYKQARTDAERQVLGTIAEAVNQFKAGEQERARMRAEGLMNAAERAAALAGSAGGSTSTAGTSTTGGGNGLTANPGPGQIGWDPRLNTPVAGDGLKAGTYTVNGVLWYYDPTTGWRKGGSGVVSNPRPYMGVSGQTSFKPV